MLASEPNIYSQMYIDKGDGEVIVLLHGLFGNLSNWKSVVDHFSEHYRVVIPRLPIFEMPSGQANLDRLTAIFEEFVLYHNLKSLTLVGNSLGGHLALLYTLRNPDKVKRLILTGSSGLFENSLGSTFPRVKDYNYIKERVQDTFHKKEVVTKELVDEVFSVVQEVPKTISLIGLARSAQQHNLSSSLHRIKTPVLLIWGLNDTVTPPNVALHFHDLLPNSDLKFIPDCGHVPMMEYPQLFNQHMSDFLKSN
jgi:2-hydroxy-6-oxonona-2,4-dienedioate hydrolase